MKDATIKTHFRGIRGSLEGIERRYDPECDTISFGEYPKVTHTDEALMYALALLTDIVESQQAQIEDLKLHCAQLVRLFDSHGPIIQSHDQQISELGKATERINEYLHGQRRFA